LHPIEKLIVDEATKLNFDFSLTNALDVGSGPGGLTFALGRHFASIIGVDHHAENIETARQVYAGEKVPFSLTGDGELSEKLFVDLSSQKPLVAKKLEFRQSDPMSLPAEMSGFNLVVLNDVIDKVSSPNSILGRLGGVRGLVKKDGLLVVISSFEWNDNTTPRSLWLGGYIDKSTGLKVSSEHTLIDKLSEDFQFLKKEQLNVMWNETQSELKVKVYNTILLQRK